MTIVVPIDRGSSVPLTQQVYEFWRAGIVNGRFARGERVPSTRDAAAALGVSRGTLEQAYEQLMSEGYFQAVRGSGTFVCRELPESRELAGGNGRGHGRGDLGADAAAGTSPSASQAQPPHDVASLVKLSSLGEELRRDTAPAEKRKGYINLSPAGPDLSLFPLDLWR